MLRVHDQPSGGASSISTDQKASALAAAFVFFFVVFGPVLDALKLRHLATTKLIVRQRQRWLGRMAVAEWGLRIDRAAAPYILARFKEQVTAGIQVCLHLLLIASAFDIARVHLPTAIGAARDLRIEFTLECRLLLGRDGLAMQWVQFGHKPTIAPLC